MLFFLSGTIGGKNVGVSPDCNMYGLKTLSEQGGSVSAILSALDVVVEFAANSGRKSIVSMSLGGICETEGMYIQYVYTLVTHILLLRTYSCYVHTLVMYILLLRTYSCYVHALLSEVLQGNGTHSATLCL
jgi:hypothetical protein